MMMMTMTMDETQDGVSGLDWLLTGCVSAVSYQSIFSGVLNGV